MSAQQPSRAELLSIIERLVAERQQLLTENARLQADVEGLGQRVEELELELARGDPPAGRPPAWVKPNKPERKGEKRPRKKRSQGFARKRSMTSERVVHAVAKCPGCGCQLLGGSVKRHREVIEIALAPAVVTEHVLVERVCPQCNKRCTPTLTGDDGVVGRHRFGPKLLALIVTLHDEGRMPVRRIQQHLATVFGVQVSVGAIEYALHLAASRGVATVAAIRQEVRQSPALHADETGWREDGQNRYVWVLATPKARYFEVGRRTNDQIDAMLGKEFSGTLITDFYSAYDHFLGEHQRCWAHLLRDVRDLVAQYPEDQSLARWARQLGRLYRAARDSPDSGASVRWSTRKRLEEITARVCQPFAATDAPQRTLSQRILKHLSELYTFVTNPAVPPTNNEAERALRPLVISRKVWGGSRSDQGSVDTMRRATLFDTWRLRGLNPFDEVQKLLLSPQI